MSNLILGLCITCYVGLSMVVGGVYFVAVGIVSVILNKPIDD